MGLLKKILNYPARWRRSRGFGVHSPFAFHFITKVLRETEAEYYAYTEIAAFCPKARRAGFNEIFAGKDMSITEAHMLFRVLCYFNPTHVVEIGHGHEVTNIILERSVPGAKVDLWHQGRTIQVDEHEPFFLVNQLHAGELNAVGQLLASVLEKGDAVVVVRNINSIDASLRLWQSLYRATTFGMGFSDSYTGFFVGRHTLPSQLFDIIL